MANMFDLAHSDSIGTKLPQEVVRQIVMQLRAKSTLLPLLDYRTIRSSSSKFTRMFINDRVLEAINTECTAPTVKSRVNGTPVVCETKQFKGCFQWSYESIEEFLMESRLGQSNNDVAATPLRDIDWQGQATEAFFTMMVDAIRSDLEYVLLQGDTASADPLLAGYDGYLKQAGQVFDVASAPFSADVVKGALNLLPLDISSNSRVVMLVNRATFYDWGCSLAGRETSLGDRMVIDGVGTEIMSLPAFGIDIVVNNNLPANTALMFHVANMGVAVQREILLETEKDIQEGCIRAVASLRNCPYIHRSDAVVRLDNTQL